jgi:FKBP-type peptidyl-prolyl cis-trans isomerase (trigger factor)
MECKLLKKEGKEIAFEMAFDALAFEKILIDTYREAAKEDKNKTQILPFLSTAALIESHPRGVQITHEAIRKIVADNYDTAIGELGIVPVSDPYIQPIQIEIGKPLVVTANILVVPNAGSLRFEGLTASYTEVYIEGSEIDDKLGYLCQYYQVANNEELISRLKAYNSIAALRRELEQSLLAFVEKANYTNKKQAAIDALLAANPMDVSAEEIDQYVMKEIQKMKNQVGEEVFEQQLKTSGRSLAALKAMIRKDVGFMPHLNLILASIAARIHFEITEDDRKKEIAAQREQSLQPAGMDSVADTLKKLKANPEILRSLDYKASLNKALDYVITKTVFSVKNRIPVKERMHPYFQ